jgi:small-conductance mechanosensitive channel
MIERILSKTQGRTVLALVRERDEITRNAQEQINELNEAIDEQVDMLRAHFDLPEGKYEIVGNPQEIKLRRVEDKAPDGEPDDPTTE